MNSLLLEPHLTIVASGAGAYALDNTSVFAREAVDISGAEKPVVVTIPTAEPTAEWHDEFVEGTQKRFGKEIGATVLNLHDFMTPPPHHEEMIEKMRSADVIHAAGGDTKYMLDFWRTYGIDTEIDRAIHAGKVISGGSAILLAWMKYGHSDWRSYHANGGRWNYEFLEGYGYINATGCPHYDDKTDDGVEMRETDFTRRFEADDNLTTHAIAADSMAAIVIKDGNYRVVTAPTAKYPRAGIHLLTKTSNGLTSETLPVSKQFAPFEF